MIILPRQIPKDARLRSYALMLQFRARSRTLLAPSRYERTRGHLNQKVAAPKSYSQMRSSLTESDRHARTSPHESKSRNKSWQEVMIVSIIRAAAGVLAFVLVCDLVLRRKGLKGRGGRLRGGETGRR